MRSGQKGSAFSRGAEQQKRHRPKLVSFRFPGAATEASLPGGSAFPAFGAVQGGVVLLDGLLLVLRRVREVERPSATMYSRVLPQP